MPEDTSFARLVSLACHDLRTPLATVHGFARTIPRLEDVGERAAKFVAIIAEASEQLAGILDDLGVVARIEGGRYEPEVREASTLELARTAAEEVGDGRVRVGGEGGTVKVEPDATARALAGLARCALRHGGLQEVELAVAGREIRLSPIAPAVAPIVLGEELRDLGAAVAVRVVRALGGSVELEGETLAVRFPAP